MSRFENYYNSTLLYEKVTKKEIDEALSNPNIIVGAEFEFIMTKKGKEVSFKDEDIAAEFEDAHDEWEGIVEMIEDYQKELVSYHRETQALKKKYDKLGLEIDKLNNEWQKAEAKKDTRTMDKLKASIKIKQKDYSDLENEIDYREHEGIKELEKPPTKGSETEIYGDYIEEYMGLNANHELRGSVEGKLPTEPVDMSESTEAHFDPEAVSKVFNYFKDAPFKNYKIGQYGEVEQKVGSDVWAIEPDGSLGTAGVEVKSPPMPVADFIKVLPKMFDWVNKHGKTTSACGFHVHMSVKGVSNLHGVLDPIKIIMFTDEGFVFNIFTERVNNQYTKSMTDKLKTGSVPSKKELEKGFDVKQALMMIASFEHEDAINLQNMEHGHMEFRHMGGNNYSKRAKDITLTIGHFAHSLAVATDESFKRREYIHKLQRIFNKLQLIYAKTILQVISRVKDTPSFVKNEKEFNKIERMYRDRYNSLSKVYNLDRKTLITIQKNKTYMNNLINDVKSELNKNVAGFDSWSAAVYQGFIKQGS